MRRVPSVDPEQLRKLCWFGLTRPGCALDAPSVGISIDTCVRFHELNRFGSTNACLLPGFIQKIIFRKVATMPLESSIPEWLEMIPR